MSFDVDYQLREIVAQVQGLVNEAYKDADSFDQLGLEDGQAIVLEYLEYGEAKLALEHILYMVDETDIIVDADLQAALQRVGDQLGS